MEETELMEIGRITLTKTECGDFKTVEFQFVNQSNYCLYSDEDVEVEITKEVAIELIENLKREFDIKDQEQLAAAKAEIAEYRESIVCLIIENGIHDSYDGGLLPDNAQPEAIQMAIKTLAKHRGK